jgi:hypothetical protein
MPKLCSNILRPSVEIRTKKRHRHNHRIPPTEHICNLSEQWLRDESREDERVRDPYVLCLAADRFRNRW